LKKHETVKLFYGTYLYKLSIRNQLASSFRERNLPLARQHLDSLQRLYEENQPLKLICGMRVIPIPTDHFIDATKLYKQFYKANNYKLRVEASILSIYSNDINWINLIIQENNSRNLISLYEPDCRYINELKTNTILVPESNGYEYKVTLGNNKTDNSFGKWAVNNPKLIKIGPLLTDELLNGSGYVSGMYFYARDDRTLQLCNIMLSNIRRIDKLVVK